MKKTALYQTIDGQCEEIPAEPVYCSVADARFGYGYYFWDVILESAHWWGEQHYKGNYIICQSHYDSHSEKYFDLVGNTEHSQQLLAMAQVLKERKPDTYTVAEVLEAIKLTTPEFQEAYWAIRVKPECKNYPDAKLDIPVTKGNRPLYVSCSWRIQMCVLNLDFLLEREYRPIYPEHHDPAYAV